MKLLTGWRNSADTAWLADAPVHPLQQTLKDLEIKLDQANNRLFLPKLGWLRYRNSRDVLGMVKNVTVSQSCGKWFVSIQTEREVEQPIPQGGVNRPRFRRGAGV